MRKLDVLLGIGTVVMLVNFSAAILVGEFTALLGVLVVGVAGIVHFRRLAAKVDLLCRAPVGDSPDAQPKRRLHRFKTVEWSHSAHNQGDRVLFVRCSARDRQVQE